MERRAVRCEAAASDSGAGAWCSASDYDSEREPTAAADDDVAAGDFPEKVRKVRMRQQQQQQRAERVLFVPALNRMCSILLAALQERSPYNNVWTLEDWTDFTMDHKLRNGEVVTSQMILSGAVSVVTSQTTVLNDATTHGVHATLDALCARCVGSDSEVRRLVDWKLMVARVDSQVREWESEMEDLHAMREGESPQGRRLKRLVTANKLVHIQTQKLHQQLQQAPIRDDGDGSSLGAVVQRIDDMMEHFPGTWPLIEDPGTPRDPAGPQPTELSSHQ
jgi:hypothetical protein